MSGVMDDRFTPYLPAEPIISEHAASGKSAVDKRRLLHGRVLYRMCRDARAARVLQRRVKQSEVAEAIDSFINGHSDDEAVSDDNSDREFWCSLGVSESVVGHAAGVDWQRFEAPDSRRLFGGKPTLSLNQRLLASRS